jgi:concentrative nucleoside transporter, CNT family
MKRTFYLLAVMITVGLLFLSHAPINAQDSLQTDNIGISEQSPEVVADVSEEAETTQQTGFKIVEPTPTFSIEKIGRGILGLIVLVFIAWIFSAKRRAVQWKVVLTGLAFQLVLAFSVLQLYPVQWFFEKTGKLFILVLDFTKEGSEFLLGSLLNVESMGFIFAFQILPTIIFFSALTSVLFYMGVIQKIVYALAWLMTKTMRLSGTESLSVAGNIFLGQTESPLLIKAYLPSMNKSEILLVMIGGMATLAGGVLAAYIGFLGGDDPVQRIVFAKHLLTASVMAAPGAVVVSKILYPQTETVNKEIKVSKEKIGSNILDAMANGTGEGIKLAVNVAGMLLVFIAAMALVNYVFFKIGDWTTLNPLIAEYSDNHFKGLSLQFILGHMFAPLMWLIGVPAPDTLLVGQLLGEKVIINEFIGYKSLSELMATNSFSSVKSVIMATYILCGFANFGSIGIQIGGIGSLAPNQRTLLSRFGFRALLGGTLAALFSATIVGMILG